MELEPRFSREEIAAAVSRVAAEISANHPDKTPLLVGILTGSFVFLADLVRELTIPVEIDFIRARSYGKGTESSGAVEITKDIEHDITGRTVILVEDILDTGLTLRFVADRIRGRRPGDRRNLRPARARGGDPVRLHGTMDPQGFRCRLWHRLRRTPPRATRHQGHPRDLIRTPFRGLTPAYTWDWNPGYAAGPRTLVLLVTRDSRLS
jgi:hypothetical protein